MKNTLLFILFMHCVINAQTGNSNFTVQSKIITAPVFIGAEKNIISTFQVNAKSINGTNRLTEIAFEADRFSARNILKSVKIFLNSGKRDSLICQFAINSKTAGKIKLNFPLAAGIFSFKIGVEIKTSSSLDSFLKIKPSYIKINNKKYLLENEFHLFRIGNIIRKPGDFNAKSYRIPGLAASNKGTLLAVYDIRKNSSKDLPADIDVGLSRSTDDGQTWLPMQVIMDMGEPHDMNGIGDPCILVDRNTGTIWVAALWSKGNNSWVGSKQGLSPDETGQFILVKSSDDGINWSQPINITGMVKNPKWNLFFQGPGNGISLEDGTLVFPAQYKDSTAMPYSTIIYSSDHGLNWKTGTGAKSNTTEAQVVELTNGPLMLNMRDNRGGSRSVAVTSNLGGTWTEHSSSRSALIEPICMASFIRVFAEIPGKRNSLLAFSNPNSKKNRDSLTVKFSTDEGYSWNKVSSILIDERDSYGYSCLTKIDDGHLGLLYEGIDEIFFVKIKLTKKFTEPDIFDMGGSSAFIKQ